MQFLAALHLTLQCTEYKKNQVLFISGDVSRWNKKTNYQLFCCPCSPLLPPLSLLSFLEFFLTDLDTEKPRVN
jgi:hypothetical protein